MTLRPMAGEAGVVEEEAALPERGVAVHLGFGRIVVSEIEAPNIFYI